MIFEYAKWIWLEGKPQINEYAEFFETFNYERGSLVLRLCAETDYLVFLNGKYLFNGQFAGYKNEKYYDEDEISRFCRKGENQLLFVVRYEGVNSACHVESGAGLIYTLENEGKTIAFSSESTLGRLSPRYVQGVERAITPQLGLTSSMTARENDSVAQKTRSVDLPYHFQKRPVPRCQNLSPVSAKKLDVAEKRLYDIGYEECGYIFLKARCKKPTDLKIAYGEHLADGSVRYLIGSRNFSFDFACKEGENEFVQYFVRAAGRYLEVLCDESVEIVDIGIIPVLYPLTVKPHRLEGIERQIYDTSVRTLRLCMHTHYEDCPWREQALYVLDSRNQMLCGYYAFKETEFQRANLVFISKGARSDGMLELTYPAVDTPAIPFFSACYPLAVCEYVEHTGDTSVIPEVMDAMLGAMNRLYAWRDETGLITNQPRPYWNFYEWSAGNNGKKEWKAGGNHDLIINCAFVYATDQLQKLCQLSGTPCPNYDVDGIKRAIVKHFYNEELGIFNNCVEYPMYTVLGNTFAMMVGLGNDRTLKAIKGERSDVSLVPATLSMLGFVYDTVLRYDPDGGQAFVLNDIYKNYTHMLSCGATSFWETIEGLDLDPAASLCHGWSAIPVYYFHQFFKDKFI